MRRFLFGYVVSERKLVVGVLALAAVVAAMDLVSVGMVVPLLSVLAGHEAVPALPGHVGAWQRFWLDLGAARQMFVIAAGLVCVACLKFAAGVGYAVVTTKLHMRVNLRIKEDILKKIFSMDLLAFQKYKMAHLHTYLGPHSNNVGEMLNSFMIPLPRFIGVFLLLATCAVLSWRVTVASLCLYAAIGVGLRRLYSEIREVGVAQKNQVKRVNFHSLDTLASFKSVVLFARDGHFSRRIHAAFSSLNAILRRKSILQVVTPAAVEAVAMLSAAAVLLLFCFLYGTDRRMTFVYVTFFVVTVRMLSYASSVLQVRAQIAVTYPATLEILDFLGRVEDRTILDGVRDGVVFENSIAFNDVSFSYDADSEFGIRGVNFFLEKGHRIGIVGPSGSGKSTVIDLLLRIVDPESGVIEVDGVPITEFVLKTWRGLFGVVPQDSMMLNATVAENIRFGDESLTDVEVVSAARLAMAEEFVRELPEGFATVVGDRGVRLSGGQRQRIAIARALANRRRILVFDEATSSLDSISEAEVLKAIDNLPRDLTVVMVAHRLSTLKGCDRIVVIDNGKSVEVGSITELNEPGSLFAKLSAEQGIVWPGAGDREE